ncbi:MAG TPA: hypothetical protein PLS49_02045 [Candidatus Woesebacteria bacterium]|nr:hypothetical protein [Candidatus Woesebacteria bacterium]
MKSQVRRFLTNKFILDQKLKKDSSIWEMYYDLVRRTLFIKLDENEKKQIESELDAGEIHNFEKLCEEKLTDKDYDIINNYIYLKVSKLFN